MILKVEAARFVPSDGIQSKQISTDGSCVLASHLLLVDKDRQRATFAA
jgi:hypothetical protein